MRFSILDIYSKRDIPVKGDTIDCNRYREIYMGGKSIVETTRSEYIWILFKLFVILFLENGMYSDTIDAIVSMAKELQYKIEFSDRNDRHIDLREAS